MWRIEGTGLTYGQMDEYIDDCSEAVDILLHLVLREAFDFEGTRTVAQGYADEYTEALVVGLRRLKEVREAKLLELENGPQP
jgi:hypothetical protein